MLRSLQGLVLALLAVSAAPAATWDVPGTVPTIEAALALAGPGDSVLVACGTYSEQGLVVPAGVTIRGASPGCVTVQGDGSARLFDCVDVTGVTFERLVLSGGTTAGGATFIDLVGGAIRADSSWLVVRDCEFRGNHAKYGAGIGARGSDVTVENCLFDQNDAYAPDWAAGGGVYGRGVDWSVRLCTFTGNTATSDSVPADGGGVFLDQCAGFFEDCAFQGNSALAGAGGLYSFSADQTAVRRCVFTGNTAAAGGAIYLEKSYAPFEDCTFVENDAANGGAMFIAKRSTSSVVRGTFDGNQAAPNTGGAIDVWNSEPALIDCELLGNAAGGGGGGLALHDEAIVALEDCLLVNNTAGGRGGAAFGEGDAVLQIARSTLVGNGAAAGGGALAAIGLAQMTVDRSLIVGQTSGGAAHCGGAGTIDLTCTDVWNNAAGDFTGCLAGQAGVNGNFSADPLFCDAGGGDYGLTLPDSPALAANNGCFAELGSEPAGCGCPVGATMLVPDDFPTIGAALAAAAPGDVIGVCSGTYPESVIVAPGVHVLGVGAEFAAVTGAGGSAAVLRATALADSTVVTGLRLDGLGVADWVVRNDSASSGLRLRDCDLTGGAVGGVHNDATSTLVLGSELAFANDIFANGVGSPLAVENLNVTADSLDATLNYWATSFDSLTASLAGPVRVCPITNAAHTDSLCAPLTAVGVAELGVTGGRLRAFPNPFRAGVELAGPTSAVAPARVEIYDVRGRRVRAIHLGPGEDASRVHWSGDDERGRAVAPGVYFVRWSAGSTVLRQKLVRLR